MLKDSQIISLIKITMITITMVIYILDKHIHISKNIPLPKIPTASSTITTIAKQIITPQMLDNTYQNIITNQNNNTQNIVMVSLFQVIEQSRLIIINMDIIKQPKI